MLYDPPPPYPGPKKEPSRIQGEATIESLPPPYSGLYYNC